MYVPYHAITERPLTLNGSFEPSVEACSRLAAKGTTKAEDLIPIYHEQTTIKLGSQVHTSSQQYYVVSLIEALNKFCGDMWDWVVCILVMGVKRDLAMTGWVIITVLP